MAALLKGAVSDHCYGGPVTLEVWGELQEPGSWFIVWYRCHKPETRSMCIQQNLKRERIGRQEI